MRAPTSDPSTQAERRRLGPSALAIGLVTLLLLLVGLRSTDLDIDEVVYRNTAMLMHHGWGYYAAIRHELVRTYGPPTQLRSIRPPTTSLVVFWAPQSWWRPMATAVMAASLVFARRLARPDGETAATLAVALVGLWLLAAAPMLYLYAEIWGLPFLFAAAWFLRNGRDRSAAFAVLGATMFRELYAVGILAGVIVGRRRGWWVLAGAAAAGLYAVHAGFALHILSAHGKEAPFGHHHWPGYVLVGISPVNSVLGMGIGVLGTVAGAIAIVRRWSSDPAARFLGIVALVLAPITLVLGRNYWPLTFGPGLAVFAGSALAPWASQARARLRVDHQESERRALSLR